VEVAMSESTERRLFLKRLALGGGAGLLTSGGAWSQEAPRPPGEAPVLSADEKAKLKAELQRELERRVYSVDEELFRKVNRALRPGHYAGHERSHVPKIVAPRRVRRLEAFPVQVVVGVEELHEMQVFHYVDWISLGIGAVQVGFASIAPIFCQPVVSFELTLERNATLRAQEHCNLHGTWESEPFEIEVA
jgi:desulfoferrodoxin (superoxide reductase-like protein)